MNLPGIFSSTFIRKGQATIHLHERVSLTTIMKHKNVNAFLMILTLLLLAVSSIAYSRNRDIKPQKISIEAAKVAPLFQAAKYQDKQGNTLPYRYFEPTTDKASQVPVILHLHGEEEAGTDNVSQLLRTECATIWVEPDHLARNPTYVLAPQIPAGGNWTKEPIYSSTLALLT
jgi:predicted peptidase